MLFAGESKGLKKIFKSPYFCSMKNTDETRSPAQVAAIVWDWNGTLLNDINICVDSINRMLRPRNIPLLSYDAYRDVFGFPVRDYYEKAGFDFFKEPFDVVAVEFIDIYRTHLPECNLFPEVLQVLEQISNSKLPQYVLSAMEQEMLEFSLREKGIAKFFRLIAGTGDHFADGKLGSAKRLQQLIDVKPAHVLMIGDTIHDYEVAMEMGWQSILISNGHQSEVRLLETGRPVLQSLIMIGKYLNGYSF
jgi:phosphoglycolate phosphatase